MNWVLKPVQAPPPGGPPASAEENLFDDTNTLVLRLWPEWTRDGNRSVGWCWSLPGDHARRGPLHAINWGYDMDKETARQQGLAALKKSTQVTAPDSESNPQHAFGHGRGD